MPSITVCVNLYIHKPYRGTKFGFAEFVRVHVLKLGKRVLVM